MPRPASTLITALVLAGFTAAGCGSSSGGGGTGADTPKAELTAAVDGIGQTDALTATLHLDNVSPNTLLAIARSQHEQLSTADAKSLASAQLVIQAKTTNGKDIADIKPSDQNATNVSISGKTNGQTLVEMRVVDGNLYLRGDVKAILDTAHKGQLYNEVQARAKTLPTFVQAVASGKWVSINGAAAQGLAGNFGGMTSSGGSNSARSQQMLNDLKRILSEDVTVTKAGTDQRGDHLVVTGQTRKISQDLVALTNTLPGGSAATSRLNPSRVPDRTVTVDVWVKDGAVSVLSINLSQFAKAADKMGPLPIAIQFDQSAGDISAPPNATPVDLSQLGTLVGALSTR